jgi:hypothetical protein
VLEKERNMDWHSVDWDEYERRVQVLEDEGMTRSDAQGIVDMEMEQEQRHA